MLPMEQANNNESSEEVLTAEKKPFKPKPKFSLHVLFCSKFDADRVKASKTVKKLHPKIVAVRFPRQKSAKYCLIDFATQKDLDDGEKHLKSIEYNGQSLNVRPAHSNNPDKVRGKMETIKMRRDAKQVLEKLVTNIRETLSRDPRHSVTNMVCIKKLPKDIKKTDVEKLFPDLMEVNLYQPDEQHKNTIAFVTLPSPRDAAKATKEKVTFRGITYKVKFPSNGKMSLKSEKRKSKKGTDSFLSVKVKEEETTDQEMSSNDEEDDAPINAYN